MSEVARGGGLCPECGATVADGRVCRDSFDALLALEWEIPGMPGQLAHFYAVSAYLLQHPDTMGLSADALRGLRVSVARALVGEADVGALRERARRVAEGARVTRRGDDDVLDWPVAAWTIRVTDIVSAGGEGYADRVEEWARSVLTELDEAGA